MANKKTMHLFDSSEAVRSVMRENKVTAQCGEVRVLTRDAFEEDLDTKICQACLKAADKDFEEYTVLSRRGWTALLEKVWLLEHAPSKSTVYSYTLSSNGVSWNWPPAA